MDKRTLLFVLGLSFALFAVNAFFEGQRHESQKEWREKHLAESTQKAEKLEKEIAAAKVPTDALPLVDLFADPQATELLGSGIRDNGNILTLAWEHDLPATVYDGTAIAYTLKTPVDGLDTPVLYQKEGLDAPLTVGLLPSFGHFELQVIDLTAQPPRTTLARYDDGQFSVPANVLSELYGQMGEEQKKRAAPLPERAVVMIQSQGRYIPVAIYQRALPHLLYLDYIDSIPTQVQHEEAIVSDRPAEKFYVLQNDYQQLVFSNYGGALAEINLPFQTKENEKSMVKSIEFDREMVTDHPNNAHFPVHPYFTAGDPKEHTQTELGGYYPLLRRDFIQGGKKKSVRVHPRFYALNIISEYPEVAELVYEVKSFDKETIVFEAKQRHRTITKTFSIAEEQEAPYAVNLSIDIEGDSRGLWLSSGVPEVELISGSPAPALKYRLTRNGKSEVVNLSLPKETDMVSSLYPDWICDSNGFLGLIIDPLEKIDPGYRVQYVSGNAVPSRIVQIGEDYERFKPKDLPGYMTMLPLRTDGGAMQFRIFAGPFANSVLRTLDRFYTNPETGENPDYIASQSFHGWFSFISEPFSKFLFILMNFFHNMTGSWAFSIVLLTITVRLMLYPLNAWSTKSMLRMKEIAPEVKVIQEKHKKDPKKAQLEVMNLYRDRGVNPLSGCFPLLIQMPFLIGMFDLLKSTFELRGASFIPGWIDNLTAPDVLFSWETPIFFIGNQFHLLPILLGVVMFLQQRLMSTAPADPAQMSDQERQQKTMGTVMSLVFMVMFYHFPSGLNIYWLSSMLFGMLQQWWTTKRMKPFVAKEQAVTTHSKGRKR